MTWGFAAGTALWARLKVPRESLRETMQVFGAGLAAGILAAVAAVRLTTHFLSDLLFGLSASDPANMIGAVLLLVGVAVAACIVPARRAHQGRSPHCNSPRVISRFGSC